MSTTTQSNSSQSAELANNVTSALTAADAAATQSLQTLSSLHQARVAQLSRAAAIAAAQFGAKSTQAAQAQAAATAAKTTAARVEIANQQASTPQPQVATGGWALQGRVYNAEQQPVTAYCVFFADAKNVYQSAYGLAYTDSTGYFLINYAGAESTQAAPQLYVEIANPKGEPVFLSTIAFTPTLGVASYRTLTLPAGEKPIGDPPATIRAVALPNTQVQTQIRGNRALQRPRSPCRINLVGLQNSPSF